jgi:hypothetical protein
MNVEIPESLEAILERVEPFELKKPQAPLCDHGQEILAWVDEWLLPEIVGDEPTLDDIKDAIVYLTIEYFSYEGRTRKDCWKHRGERGHRCVHQIFAQTFKQLQAKLHTQKRLASKPPPPPPPKEKIVYLDRLYGLEVK